MAYQKKPNDLLRSARLARLSPSGSGRPMSRQELADAVNANLFTQTGRSFCMDANHIGQLERGRHRWPAVHYREALCAVLGAECDADLGFFVNRAPERPAEPQPALDSTTAPDRDMKDSAFATRLRDLRLRRGLSLREVGGMVHYSRSTLSELEHGQKRPTPAMASLLDQALGADGQLSALVADRAAVQAVPAGHLGIGNSKVVAGTGGLSADVGGVPAAGAAAGSVAVRVDAGAGVQVTVVCREGVPGRVAVLAGAVRVFIDASGVDPGGVAPPVIDGPPVPISAGGARVYSLAQRRAG